MHKFHRCLLKEWHLHMQILPNAFSFLFLACAVFNSCKHITQTKMGSITTHHGMCELFIAKRWVWQGQATSTIGARLNRRDKGILENKVPSMWLHCASVLIRGKMTGPSTIQQWSGAYRSAHKGAGARRYLYWGLGRRVHCSTEPGDTKYMYNMANETRNTAGNKRLSAKMKVHHHLPTHLSHVLLMLWEISGRGHSFSSRTFKHSLHQLHCASLLLFPLPTTGTLGCWWEREVKHLLKSLGDQRHLIQSNFQATPPCLKCVSFTWR